MSCIHTQLGATPRARRWLSLHRDCARHPGVHVWLRDPDAEPGAQGGWPCAADFPGGWAGDAADGTSGQGLSAEARDAQDYLRRLLTWRRGASAVTSGTLTQFAPQNGTYVYFRRDARQLVMVAFNKTGAERRLDPARFAEMIGGNTTCARCPDRPQLRARDGITLPPESATILELTGAPPMPAGVTGTIETRERVESRFVDPRRVDVWLPPRTARTRRAAIPSSTCTTGRTSSIPRSLHRRRLGRRRGDHAARSERHVERGERRRDSGTRRSDTRSTCRRRR